MRNAGGTRAVTAARRAFVAPGLLFLLCCLAGGVSAVMAQVAPGEPVRATQYFPALDRPPLDPPLRLSGDFGEYRPGHFLAGLDFASGGQVGLPVYASLPGSGVRVRASGRAGGRPWWARIHSPSSW